MMRMYEHINCLPSSPWKVWPASSPHLGAPNSTNWQSATSFTGASVGWGGGVLAKATLERHHKDRAHKQTERCQKISSIQACKLVTLQNQADTSLPQMLNNSPGERRNLTAEPPDMRHWEVVVLRHWKGGFLHRFGLSPSTKCPGSPRSNCRPNPTNMESMSIN